MAGNDFCFSKHDGKELCYPSANALGRILDAEEKKRLWVPEGFAHGFLVLSKTAEFLYKTTDCYAPEYARSLLQNDPALGIQWPVEGEPKLAAKDLPAEHLSEAKVFA
jgi:dTDP-4-dehydrorhamnose 3,5-epimerase